MMARMHSLLLLFSTMSWTILGPETDSSSIERLGGSEVVHNVLHKVVIYHPEGLELSPGDLERREEVDPLDRLGARRSGEGSLVSAVPGGSCSAVNRSHGLEEVHQL